jgi:hypothetical protein
MEAATGDFFLQNVVFSYSRIDSSDMLRTANILFKFGSTKKKKKT